MPKHVPTLTTFSEAFPATLKDSKQQLPKDRKTEQQVCRYCDFIVSRFPLLWEVLRITKVSTPEKRGSQMLHGFGWSILESFLLSSSGQHGLARAGGTASAEQLCSFCKFWPPWRRLSDGAWTKLTESWSPKAQQRAYDQMSLYRRVSTCHLL